MSENLGDKDLESLGYEHVQKILNHQRIKQDTQRFRKDEPQLLRAEPSLPPGQQQLQVKQESLQIWFLLILRSVSNSMILICMCAIRNPPFL